MMGASVDYGRLYGLLSECFKHPDDRFLADARDGALEAELRPLLASLDVAYEVGVDETLVPASAAAFDNEYISLFEAFEEPYAPVVESPYKAWHDGPGTDGLLNGPAAGDMRERYASVAVERPDAYQPDHLALLLEYAALVTESGTTEQHKTFLAEHLDWIPALHRLVEAAAADAPFHRRYVEVTADALEAVRNGLGVEEPSDAAVDHMVDRVREGMDSLPEEKSFRP
jgi:TorA maturation chaperone TorD